MSKKQIYNKIKDYNNYLVRFKKYKWDFEVCSTTYTKKIITKNCIYFFNEDGKEDVKQLLLISAVRNDAKKFLQTHKNISVGQNKTDFFNLLDNIKSDTVIKKVDLRSAYWTYAMKMGVVTEETNNKFIEWYKNKVVSFSKNARLKALGSLATTKYSKFYEKGILIKDSPPESQFTKDLYMEICNGIDRLMKDLNFNVDGCLYYYWDCMFIDSDAEEEVVAYLNKRGYEVSVEEIKIEFLTMGGNGYLYSLDDGKMYMTKRENRHLLIHEEDFVL